MNDRKMKYYAYRVYACGTRGNLERLRPIRPICPLSHLIAHRPHLLCRAAYDDIATDAMRLVIFETQLTERTT